MKGWQPAIRRDKFARFSRTAKGYQRRSPQAKRLELNHLWGSMSSAFRKMRKVLAK